MPALPLWILMLWNKFWLRGSLAGTRVMLGYIWYNFSLLIYWMHLISQIFYQLKWFYFLLWNFICAIDISFLLIKSWRSSIHSSFQSSFSLNSNRWKPTNTSLTDPCLNPLSFRHLASLSHLMPSPTANPIRASFQNTSKLAYNVFE